MKNRIAILAVLSVFLVSCIEEVPIGEHLDRIVTVNCLLTPDEDVQTVDIKYSGKMSERSLFFPLVQEAKVSLYEDGTLIGEFQKRYSSQWILEFRPTGGKTYRLEVEVPGEEPIHAETTMPFPAPVEKGEYLQPKTWKQYVQNTSAQPYWIFILDSYSDMEDYRLVEEIATNHPFVDNFNSVGQIIYSYYGTGHFPEHRRYLRISESTLDEPLRFLVEGDQNNSLVYFRAVSSDYDLYLKSSLEKAYCYLDPNGYTSWFEENVVYSNIRGGLGIFGAYTDVVFRQISYPLPR